MFNCKIAQDHSMDYFHNSNVDFLIFSRELCNLFLIVLVVTSMKRNIEQGILDGKNLF